MIIIIIIIIIIISTIIVTITITFTIIIIIIIITITIMIIIIIIICSFVSMADAGNCLRGMRRSQAARGTPSHRRAGARCCGGMTAVLLRCTLCGSAADETFCG